MDNLQHIADDIRHVAEILKASNDAAFTKRLDLFQADCEALMAVDMDSTVARMVRARNNVLAGNRG